MVNRLSFVVYSRAAPQGSKKLIFNRMIESSKRVKPFRQDVRIAAMDNTPAGWDLSQPMHVTYVFHFARPKSHFTSKGKLSRRAPEHPTGRNIGDIEKLARAVSDALTGVIYHDDSQVVEMDLRKTYDECDLVLITARPLPTSPRYAIMATTPLQS